LNATTTYSGVLNSYLSFLISLVLIVSVLLIVYFLLRRYILKTRSNEMALLIERLVLDRNTTIYLVKLSEKYLYIASTPGGVTVLREVDESEIIDKLPRKGEKFSNIFYKKLGKYSLEDEIQKLEKMK